MTLQEFFYRLGDLAGRSRNAPPHGRVRATGDDPLTGVWMSRPAAYAHETEIMIARGEDEARAAEAWRAAESAGIAPADSGTVVARDTEQPKTVEPRIERYRDR